MTQVPPIGDQERSIFRVGEGHLIRFAVAHHHLHPPLGEGGLRLLQALQHEGVVPQIGLRIVVH